MSNIIEAQDADTKKIFSEAEQYTNMVTHTNEELRSVLDNVLYESYKRAVKIISNEYPGYRGLFSQNIDTRG